MAISLTDRDFACLGEYDTLEDVWKLFPTGGSSGQYILVRSKRYEWNELQNRWSDGTEVVPPVGGNKPPWEGDMPITGDVYARDVYAQRDIYTGRNLTVHGEADITYLKAAVLKIVDYILAKDIRMSGDIGSEDFVEKLIGWSIKKDGTAYLKSLHILESLEVDEFRYNRVSIVQGEEWRSRGGGVIKSVDTSNQIIELTLEGGDWATCDFDDICKGIYHHNNGFNTAFFRITEQLDESHFKYTLREGYSFHPQPYMHFVCYGNFTNKDRQNSYYSALNYLRFLSGVNTWEISKDMIKMQFGDLSNLKIFGIDMSGYSAFLQNIYMTGTIKQISGDGKTEVPILCPKGVWVPGGYYKNDEVTHLGSLWWCKQDTTTEPADGLYWEERVSKGGRGLAGAVLRMRGRWSQSTRYERTSQFVDVVIYGDNNWSYIPKEGLDIPAGTLPTNSGYWEEFNEFSNIATGVLLAKNAWIDILDTNGIRIGENGWILTEGEIRHQESGLTLTSDGEIKAPANGIKMLAGDGYKSVESVIEQTAVNIKLEVKPAWFYRNLISGTKLPYLSIDRWIKTDSCLGEYSADTENNALKFAAINGWNTFYYNLPDAIGKTVTMSGWFKRVNGSSPFGINNTDNRYGVTYPVAANTTDWTYNSVTYTIEGNSAVQFCIFMPDFGTPESVLVRELQVEYGSSATEWTPAADEMDNALRRTGIDISSGKITLDAENVDVTGKLLSKAIQTEELNVNNNFIVKPDGAFTAKSGTFGGYIQTVFKKIEKSDALNIGGDFKLQGDLNLYLIPGNIVILPNDIKYNGVHVNLFCPPQSGTSSLLVCAIAEGGRIIVGNGKYNEMPTELFWTSGMHTFICVQVNDTHVSWCCTTENINNIS